MAMLDPASVVGTFVIGAAGWLATWFVTHNVAGPILNLRTLRQQIHEELFFIANVGWVHANGTLSPTEQTAHDQAVTQIRRLAARMSAIEATWPRYLSWYLRSRRFNLDDSVKGLTGISNGLADPAYHTQFVTQVERALSLPRSYSDEVLGHLREAQQRRLKRKYEEGEP